MKRFLGLIGIVLWATMARGADVGELVKQLKDGDNEARRAAAKALGEGGAESKAAVPALIEALKDKDTFVRRFSAQALGEIGPDASSAVRPLTAALNDSQKRVQAAAARALGKLGPSGVETLVGILKDDSKDSTIRRQAIDSLSGLGAEARSAVPVLTELLKEKVVKGKKKQMAPEDLRVDAATALGTLAKSSDKETIETLEALTEKKAKTPRGLKQAANTALKKIKNNK
jgi:HEAT repeat protein